MRWSLPVLFLLSGCFIVLDGEEEVDRPDRPDDRPPAIDAGCYVGAQPYWRRDPLTAECTNYGGDPEPSCPSKVQTPIPIPPYPECETACNPLEERECLQTAGCRGFYAGEAQGFAACYAAYGWQPDPAVPCGSITDAFECGGRDDCSSWHVTVPGPFRACLDEEAPTPVSCEGLDEAACIDNACEPLYEGLGCDCTPAGCTCEDWAYIGCRTQT